MNGLFRFTIGTYDCHVKYARGRQAVEGQEFHDYDEIVMFLEGDSQLISEDIQLQLTPGSVVLIPKERYHRFYVREQDRYCRCILGFRETPELRTLIRSVMTEVTVVPQPSEAVRFLFGRLMSAAENPRLSEEERVLLLRAVLIQILMEYKLSDGETIQKNVTLSHLTRQALQYIDTHLSEDLKLEALARQLNVSVSTVSHRFRRELNISVYRYVTEKRLSAVRQYVQAGMSLSEAARRSGFRDYAGFFRLYRSFYGESPSSLSKQKM